MHHSRASSLVSEHNHHNLGSIHWLAAGASCTSFGLERGLSWRKLFRGSLDQVAQFQCRMSGPGIDIWRSCRLIGAPMRSVCTLPSGIGRFVHCRIGADHCRLRHIGWEKCGRGLASRPRETASVAFLDELLIFFKYPPGCAPALL